MEYSPKVKLLDHENQRSVCCIPWIESNTTATKKWNVSDDDCRTWTRDHEHGVSTPNCLIINVDSHNSVGAKSLCPFHHLSDWRVFCLSQNLLLRLASSAHYITDSCQEVFDEVGTDNGFACYNALILNDFVPFDGGCCWNNHNFGNLIVIESVDFSVAKRFTTNE